MGVCYFPQVILLSLFGTIYRNWKTEWGFAITVVHLNSSVNPILYCWRLRELKAAVFQTVSSCCLSKLKETEGTFIISRSINAYQYFRNKLTCKNKVVLFSVSLDLVTKDNIL